MKLKPGTFHFIIHDLELNCVIKPGDKHANKYHIDVHGNLIHGDVYVNDFELELINDSASNAGLPTNNNSPRNDIPK